MPTLVWRPLAILQCCWQDQAWGSQPQGWLPLFRAERSLLGGCLLSGQARGIHCPKSLALQLAQIHLAAALPPILLGWACHGLRIGFIIITIGTQKIRVCLGNDSAIITLWSLKACSTTAAIQFRWHSGSILPESNPETVILVKSRLCATKSFAGKFEVSLVVGNGWYVKNRNGARWNPGKAVGNPEIFVSGNL